MTSICPKAEGYEFFPIEEVVIPLILNESPRRDPVGGVEFGRGEGIGMVKRPKNSSLEIMSSSAIKEDMTGVFKK